MRAMIKRIAFIGATILLTVLGLGGSCGVGAARIVRGIMNGSSGDTRFFRWCFGGLPLVDKLDKILGDKTYIVLLQNNTELRASGGFMGSYARFKVQGSRFKGVEVEDIYQPDGQLVGYVEPPAPIKQAFPFGSWKLRDSNWDVDFSVAGEQIAWFLEQGGEKVDGIIAINMSFVNALLEALGEVKTVTYDERVTVQNLANLAQTYSEVNKEKREFLGAVGAVLWEKIKNAKPTEEIKILRLIYDQLQKGQILMWMRDRDLRTEIERLGWGGSLGNYGGDYLYVVESNLGANKANCCVQRMITQDLQLDEHMTREKLTIQWTNTSEFENPKPPVFWGGNYINYVRVVLPAMALIKDAEKYDIETRGRFKIVGFWVRVPAGGSAVAELSYEDTKRLSDEEYRILVRRQPGIESFPYKLIVDGKVVVSDTIDRDREYTWTK